MKCYMMGFSPDNTVVIKYVNIYDPAILSLHTIPIGIYINYPDDYSIQRNCKIVFMDRDSAMEMYRNIINTKPTVIDITTNIHETNAIYDDFHLYEFDSEIGMTEIPREEIFK